MSLILILGIILSIVVFRTKSIAAEVIAWICSIIWFFFYQFLKNAKFPDIGFLVDFSRYLIFMIFFLLLQYHANSSGGILRKIFYIAKSILLVICMCDMLLFVLETFISEPDFSSIFIFDGLFWSVQLASLVFGGAISALIASSIYLEQQGSEKKYNLSYLPYG